MPEIGRFMRARRPDDDLGLAPERVPPEGAWGRPLNTQENQG